MYWRMMEKGGGRVSETLFQAGFERMKARSTRGVLELGPGLNVWRTFRKDEKCALEGAG